MRYALLMCADESAPVGEEERARRTAALGSFAGQMEARGTLLASEQDLDEAIEVAAAVPAAWYGTVEVRPVQQALLLYFVLARCAASRGMAAIFSSVRSSQQMPMAGRGPRRWRQSITRSGVTIRSTGTSWLVSGMVPASTSWSSWTVVTQTVSGPIRPAAVARANSRS